MTPYPDPASILSGELGEWLAGLEEERRAATRKGVIRLAIALPIALIALTYVFVTAETGWLGKVVGALTVLGLIYVWAQAPTRAIMPALKIEFNAEIARAMELEYAPYPEANFAYECATYFSLLPQHDKGDFEDLWAGEFDGRSFELIEVHLRREKKDPHSRTLRSVFRGALLSIRTQTEFQGATLIREKDPMRDWGETYLVEGPASPSELGTDPVTFDDAGFDARFECFSEDPDEARRLITPRLIHELLQIEDVYPGGKHTSAVFHDGHFVLVVNSGNLFESGSHGASSDHAMVAATIEQFARIAEVSRSV